MSWKSPMGPPTARHGRPEQSAPLVGAAGSPSPCGPDVVDLSTAEYLDGLSGAVTPIHRPLSRLRLPSRYVSGGAATDTPAQRHLAIAPGDETPI
jgi:hypothetical protein